MMARKMMMALGRLGVQPPKSLSKNELDELVPAEHAPDAEMTEQDESKVEIVVETA
jgi:hypothetical protein